MKNRAFVSMLAESFLRSALEAMVVGRTMDAEGRTEMTAEEEAKLQAETDAAATAARKAGEGI